MTVGIPPTRQSLLVRLRNAGDAGAWSEFESIYRPAVYRFSRRRGLQVADAEDLAQQVMLAIAKKVPQWSTHSQAGSFRAWLLTVTRNAISNSIRRAKPDRAAGGSEMLVNLTSLADDNEAEAEIDWEFRRATYRWAATEVQKEFQLSTWKAFHLTAIQTQSAEEVAKALGVSIGAVYTNRSRVLKRLRELVRELEDVPGALQ